MRDYFCSGESMENQMYKINEKINKCLKIDDHDMYISQTKPYHDEGLYTGQQADGMHSTV